MCKCSFLGHTDAGIEKLQFCICDCFDDEKSSCGNWSRHMLRCIKMHCVVVHSNCWLLKLLSNQTRRPLKIHTSGIWVTAHRSWSLLRVEAYIDMRNKSFTFRLSPLFTTTIWSHQTHTKPLEHNACMCCLVAVLTKIALDLHVFSWYLWHILQIQLSML